jgi:hypothetical protein
MPTYRYTLNDQGLAMRAVALVHAEGLDCSIDHGAARPTLVIRSELSSAQVDERVRVVAPLAVRVSIE